MAAALHAWARFVHARRHRRAEADRRAQSGRDGQRRVAAAAPGAVSCSPGLKAPLADLARHEPVTRLARQPSAIALDGRDERAGAFSASYLYGPPGCAAYDFGTIEPMIWLWLLAPLAAIVAILALPPLRRAVVSDRAARAAFRKLMPPMSQTEREAIEAGTVWWDGELFSGKPGLGEAARATRRRRSPPRSRRFLDGEIEELCAMVNDWDTDARLSDLPPHVWQFIKDKGFLGMIIPKEYGGLGFSAYAHSQVITKLSTRCGTAAVTVMVPNSLGPAELLLHYGTEEQKRHYLPRLAKGQEIPCFALTNPHAGSDAAAIPDYGVVCRGEHEGQATCSACASPGTSATSRSARSRRCSASRSGSTTRTSSLGGKEDLGITCALVPTTHPGVHIGRRHMPLNAVFQNGPNWGKDVFIPLDWVIGGQPMVGQGWRMLMECLAAGRCDLAARRRHRHGEARGARDRRLRARAQAVQAADRHVRGHRGAARAHRRQPLHDGRDAPLTAAAVDLGEKPSVVSGDRQVPHHRARAPASSTTRMDILGGKGICLGPRTSSGGAYMQMPIAITVEGANILTRSLIIFGQGAIRCHPFVLKEMRRHARRRPRDGVARVRRGAVGPLRFTLSNLARTLVLGFTGSHFVRVPGRRRAGDAPLLPAAHALLGGARVPRRRLDGHARRRAEAQGEAVGAARRHPVAALPVLGDAEALRGRGAAGGRRAADALGDLGRDVQGAERVRGRHLQLPEPLRRAMLRRTRVPARPSVRRAVGPARPRGRAAADRRRRRRATG